MPHLDQTLTTPSTHSLPRIVPETPPRSCDAFGLGMNPVWKVLSAAYRVQVVKFE